MFKLKSFMILLLLAIITYPSFGQGVKAFKLKNGLSVYIWEDNTKTNVFGMVGVRTGSVNDPEQYTGLAHYLEHVLFKGTTKLGALDWEKEEPIYNKIIAKYDEMAATNDPVKKSAIQLEINDLTVQESKVSVSNEFFNLMENMGCTGVNAATSFDMTFFHNTFPVNEVDKWLEISSERFLNPVFRNFQTELETVFEEYNRGMDNAGRRQSEFLMSKAFAGHPYGRSIIGLPEHLKNPRLSQLIKYYNDWYSADNMVLILVGNVNTDNIKNHIARAFGRLPQHAMPERKTYPDLDMKGRVKYTEKVGSYPHAYLIYPGVKSGDPDEKALEIVTQLLSNSSETGVLDKFSLDGDISYSSANLESMREQGRCIIDVAPIYDSNQHSYNTIASAEKKALQGIKDIADGKFDEWIVNGIKADMCRSYDLTLEDNESRGQMLLNAFINNMDLKEVLDYKNEIMNVSIDEIKRVAKKYLGDNYLALYIEEGNKNDKKIKVTKPNYKSIDIPQNQLSIYGQQLNAMRAEECPENFINFANVEEKKLNERSKFIYSKNNNDNNIFSMTIKFGVGSRTFPQLGMAAALMNSAGIMAAYEPQDLKKALNKLNINYSVSANDDYMTIGMMGNEANLQAACQLLSRQLLMPKLDDKQVVSLRGSILSSRYTRKMNPSALSNAMMQYIMYKKNSPYIDEVTDGDITELSMTKLTGDITRAAKYQAEIYYSGHLSSDDAFNILSKNLPLVAEEKVSDSPQDRPMAEVEENTVYFLPNYDVEQAQIFFFMPTKSYDPKESIMRSAFYQYFSGDFSGLVLSELREKRSMVYTAYGAIGTPELPGHPTYFTGQIGTQNDKANDAIELYMSLLRNMPENPQRIENIKNYLRQELLSSKPDDRSLGAVVEQYKRLGFTDDPKKEMLKQIDALTFDQLMSFYKQYIKDKPIAIGIMGNPKKIDTSALKKFGKFVKLSPSDLYNSKNTIF